MKYFSITIILFLTFGMVLMSHNEDPYLSKEESLINNILDITAKRIEKNTKSILSHFLQNLCSA